MNRIAAAAFACLFAIISTPADSAPLQFCAADQTYRVACPGSVERTGGLPRGSRSGRRNSISLSGLPGPLVAKVREIQAACGSKVVSAYRPGARTPSGHLSNHARRKAADLQGNPRCIYARLRGWPGGYSTDYARAPGGAHVHISYNPGGMEWGYRFAHRRSTSSMHARSRR